MPELSISLLGNPEIQANGQPVAIERRINRALHLLQEPDASIRPQLEHFLEHLETRIQSPLLQNSI